MSSLYTDQYAFAVAKVFHYIHHFRVATIDSDI
eukprot:CAMPEP_0202714768 /NCGR_PEP_ID=MMETSP1385-20130828/79874_1 /ASSEMBLY_ACC=CAM_ASM_000861 /TAXON_ID=933848 /ORGANISM="Elphidium margaritaceum" /LENGTH=32 /DNA_ID= /DNA_START= /DNA_END= /DNA_ORIENTATION=